MLAAARSSTASPCATSRTSSRCGCSSRTTPRGDPSTAAKTPGGGGPLQNQPPGKSLAPRKDLLPRVEAAHESMKRSRREHDTAAFTASDRLFHELIVDAAENEVLSSIYRSLRERQTLFTSVIMRGRDDRMVSAIAEHERILEALRGDDRQAFCDAVNRHLQWSIALARESH